MCVSPACSACVRPRSHRHHLPADTKFPFLSQHREWNEGKSAAGAGRGRAAKLLSAAAQAAAPSQGQVPGAAAPAGGGGAGQPRAGCRRGRGAWVRSSHLARGGPPGSPRGGWRCPPEEPWGEKEFWSPVLFRPQHSCPRVSHPPGRPAPALALPAAARLGGGRVAQGLPSSASARTLRTRRAGMEGPGTPSPPAA